MILCSSIVQYDFSNSSSFCPSKLPHHQASPNLGVVCCSMNNNKSIPYPPHRKPHMFAALPHSRTASTVCTKNFDHLNTTKCGSSNRTLNAMALELLHCSQKNQKTWYCLHLKSCFPMLTWYEQWHAYNLIAPTDLLRASAIRRVTTESTTGSTSSTRVHITLLFGGSISSQQRTHLLRVDQVHMEHGARHLLSTL